MTRGALAAGRRASTCPDVRMFQCKSAHQKGAHMVGDEPGQRAELILPGVAEARPTPAKLQEPMDSHLVWGGDHLPTAMGSRGKLS